MNNKTKGNRTIIQNELICKKCNDVIYSKHRHDFKGIQLHQARIDNALILFGKYYQGLWM
jgi:hypothetical protein